MAAKYNITIDQGSTFRHNIVVNTSLDAVVDLTGFTARAQIRYNYYSTDVVESFTCTIPSPTNGTVNIALSAAETELISEDRYVYDVELINSSDDSVTRIMQGNITVYPEVTKVVG